MHRTNDGCTHVGFADEAYKSGEYRSIACVSMPVQNYQFVVQELSNARQVNFACSELKWAKINGHKKQIDAEDIIDNVVELASENSLRVDVLVWDKKKRPYKTQGAKAKEKTIDDLYFRILKDIQKPERWCDGYPNQYPGWAFYIDELGELNEGELVETLKRYSCPNSYIEQVKSDQYILVQVADIFAGIGAFSYVKYEKFSTWLENEKEKQQPHLLPELRPEEDRSSGVDKWRFPLMRFLKERCSEHSMYLSLSDVKKGFWTRKPGKAAINFWPYDPNKVNPKWN